ncbi:oligopeptide ABC transporter permease [Erysipelotrichaceae bacterium]|nr:oligopeptide ABC transporter permease [Erysipelotrichaceae bacterium]
MEQRMKSDYLEKQLFEFATHFEGANEQITSESISFWRGSINRLFKQKVTLISMVIITLIILGAIIIPFGKEALVLVQDPRIQNLPPKIPFLSNMGIFDGFRGGADAYAKVGVERFYFFGTDELGRDIFLRLWFGMRTSLLIALIVTTSELVIGSVIGGISGYIGGTVDIIIQRIIEILVNIPTLIVMMVLTLAMGASFTTLVLALVIFGWIGFSRLVRAQILKYKELEFVLAAKTLGANPLRIMFQHLLPNMLSTFVVALTLSFPAVILSEAYYTLLGMGLPISNISLGQLIVQNVGKLTTYASQLIIPTIFMATISLTFNLFGNGLRDALDPKMKDR